MFAYLFHPLVGESVLIVGENEFFGIRHLIIRRPDGTAFNVPAWMLGPEAVGIEIVGIPRLAIEGLHELRVLLDRLMASSSEEAGLLGGMSHGPMVDTDARSVRTAPTGAQAAAGATRSRGEAARDLAEGGKRHTSPRGRSDRRTGGGR